MHIANTRYANSPGRQERAIRNSISISSLRFLLSHHRADPIVPIPNGPRQMNVTINGVASNEYFSVFKEDPFSRSFLCSRVWESMHELVFFFMSISFPHASVNNVYKEIDVSHIRRREIEIKYDTSVISWQKYKKRNTKSYFQSIIKTIIFDREIVIIKNDKSDFEMLMSAHINVYYFLEFFYIISWNFLEQKSTILKSI